MNFEDARMKKFLVPTAALLDRCAEMLTYNVCKKNLNFEDVRMKKFLVLTVALLINTRKNTYVQRMQKELEF